MAANMFIKLTGIDGETTNASHKNEIELLTWNCGMTQQGHAVANAGVTNGKVNINDFYFSKVMDKASTNLQQFCCAASPIKNAKVSVLKQVSGKQTPYFVIEMTDCVISSYQTSGQHNHDGQLTENLSLNFTTIKWTYTQTGKDTKGGASATAGWDVAQNIAVT